jgi:hypothetical protein
MISFFSNAAAKPTLVFYLQSHLQLALFAAKPTSVFVIYSEALFGLLAPTEVPFVS